MLTGREEATTTVFNADIGLSAAEVSLGLGFVGVRIGCVINLVTHTSRGAALMTVTPTTTGRIFRQLTGRRGCYRVS